MSDTMKRMWTDRQIRALAADTAEQIIEAGETENAKPVYCHPLEIYLANVLIFTALIFNNSSEKINSWQKLKEAIAAFGGETYNRLLVTGGFYGDSKIVIASEIIHIKADSKYKLIGMGVDGTIYSVSNAIDLTSLSIQVVDDVNKIN